MAHLRHNVAMVYLRPEDELSVDVKFLAGKTQVAPLGGTTAGASVKSIACKADHKYCCCSKGRDIMCLGEFAMCV